MVASTDNVFALQQSFPTQSPADAVELYDAQTGLAFQTIGNPEVAEAVGFGHDGTAIGDTILIGAPFNSNGGKVYLYDSHLYIPGGHSNYFNVSQTFSDPAGQAGDMFGYSVAAAENGILIGAPGTNNGKGAAYLFDPLTGQLLQTLAPNGLLPMDPQHGRFTGDAFGTEVAGTTTSAYVTALHHDSGGSVFVFTSLKDVQGHEIQNPEPVTTGSNGLYISGKYQLFGEHLQAYQNTILIGAADWFGTNTTFRYQSEAPYSQANVYPGITPVSTLGGLWFGYVNADRSGFGANNTLSEYDASGTVVHTYVDPDPVAYVGFDDPGADAIPVGSQVLFGSGAAYHQNPVFDGLAIANLTPLAGLENLRTLSLAYNQVSSLDAIALTHLTHLYLDDNRIASITDPAAARSGITAVLPSFTHLDDLSLQGNPLNDDAYTIITSLPSTTHVDYQLNQRPQWLQDIGPQGAQGTHFELDLTATDPDGNSVFYTASSDNPGVSVSVQAIHLTATPTLNFTGIVYITVTAYDGPSGDRDWHGRSAVQTFPLSFGTVYGQVSQTTGQALSGWTVYFDVNNNGMKDSGEPFTTTDPNGNYVLANLDYATGTVREQAPDNATNWAQDQTGYPLGQARDDFANNFLVLEPLASTGVPEGIAVDYSASWHDPKPANGGHVSYLWWVTNGADQTIPTSMATTQNYSFTPPDEDTYTVYSQVIDLDDQNHVYQVKGSLTTTNVPPSVQMGAPQAVNEGDLVSLDAADYFTDPSTVDSHTYRWHVGTSKGVAVADSTSQLFTFLAGRTDTYTVTLQVTDEDNGIGSGQLAITANNVAPSAGAGGPYTIPEGASLTLSATAADPGGPGDIANYSWDINGDGIFGDATGVNPQVSWTELAHLGITHGPASFNSVRVKVTDKDNAVTVSPSTELTVAASPPTNVTAGGPYSIDEGDSLTLLASANDPAGLDRPIRYTWDVTGHGTFGDATGSNPTLSWSELNVLGIVSGPGTYTITVLASSVSGATTIASTTFTIANLAPNNVSPGGPYTINEGDALPLTASATDPAGSDDSLTYSWDINGDGTFGDATGSNPTLAWAQLSALGIVASPGDYTARVQVVDAGGAKTTASTTLTVFNQRPTNASAGGSYTINEGDSLTLTASATDPGGSGDPLTYTWDINGDGLFGDAIGSSATLTWAQLNSLGIVQSGASYQVSMQVIDDGGLTATSPATALTITAVAPTSVAAGGPYTVVPGNSLRLSAIAIQPGGVSQPLTYKWDINGDGVFGEAIGQNPTLSWDQLLAMGARNGDSVFNVSVEAVNSLGLSTASAAVPLNVPSVQSQNAMQPLDVDSNGIVQTLDATLVIQWLLSDGIGPPPGPGESPPAYLDTTGNNYLEPRDALLVINWLLRYSGGGLSANLATALGAAPSASSRATPRALLHPAFSALPDVALPTASSSSTGDTGVASALADVSTSSGGPSAISRPATSIPLIAMSTAFDSAEVAAVDDQLIDLLVEAALQNKRKRSVQLAF